jgi:hypothetical protein
MHRLVKAHRHPELANQTIWDVLQAERPKHVLRLRADLRLPCFLMMTGQPLLRTWPGIVEARW